MSNIDIVLNSIYCLSYETLSNLTNLRLYPNILKNPYSKKLDILLNELQANTLQAFKEIKLSLEERDFSIHLREVFSAGYEVQKTYVTFISTADLPQDHILVRKLKLQVNNILFMLINLAKIATETETVNDESFISLHFIGKDFLV